ncbi:MAG: hypothetical protein A4E52_00932 [Pelotomaculum sp. PtaB.Bin013]|uniref:DUF2867 domain-containing protein n=1 Tax=Pelotomaculum isophthalicicum JI TaxID=947010 RepID=A0A9X4H2H1_9FIRM|nr:hypothetical protein [Pelotomaculum isophthalicicum]MDF9408835.1 hypothetical protein [Pelotomaculum isophthalicicum JI]OPX89778.1 MAG: hypothetical protein A4E52_00932 [Pelotomaculum sp. PtaB.Bin013]
MMLEASGMANSRKLNNYLPEYDFAEKHKIVVKSSPEKIFEAIQNLDMGKSKIIKNLIKIRGIYSLLNPREKSVYQSPIKLTIEEMTRKSGFISLEDVSNQEMVMGFIGKFWQPTSGIVQLSGANDFIHFNQTGYCKAAWNFYLQQNTGDTVTLSTETRVLCLGCRAKFLFRIYWLVIRPFSGWIRLEMLKMTKELAEGKNGKD